MTSPTIEAIYKRRSIREYTNDEVTPEQLREIVRAGAWAPSGLNNQPWRFVIVRDPAVREQLAGETHYSHIIKAAPAVIAVFLDKGAMYDEVKDHQAAGACIQNMLLTVHELELGAVWLGQILKNKSRVNGVLQLSDQYDLMALLAIGHPQHRNQRSERQPLTDFILHEFRGDTQ